MAGTITPVVYGSSRVSGWYWLMAVYTVCQIAGAAVTGVALGTIGAIARVLRPWELTDLIVPVAILGATGALHDMKLLPFDLPTTCWQVPQSWKRFCPSVMAACYGFGIGVGVLTRIPFASFYLVLFASAAGASAPGGVGLMSIYGATRSFAVALVARGQAAASDPYRRLTMVRRLGPLIGYLDGIALAGVTGFLLGQFLIPYS